MWLCHEIVLKAVKYQKTSFCDISVSKKVWAPTCMQSENQAAKIGV